MSVGERDPHTGHMTTGHDWNGIKELNTPVPWPVYFFLIATAAFSIVYWLLMPAWPLGVTYTKGLLGIDQRKTVAEKLEQAAINRAEWVDRIEAADFLSIQADDAMMSVVRETGKTLFEDNCSACHGREGGGGNGYPSLADGQWLWGGSPEMVAETLRVGVNSAHDETRISEMLAFGRQQILNRDEILNVTSFVQSLSDPSLTAGPEADAVAAGRDLFAANCAACHGEGGTGSTEIGAPNLADGFWIYGGDRQSIYTTVFDGRRGHMPHWEQRLSSVERKILTLYVLNLGVQEK